MVTAEANSSATERTATITITAAGATAQTVTVTQDKAFINISRKWLEVDAEVNSTDTFTIFSSTSWTITCSETWLTVSPESGSNTENITVTVAEGQTVGTPRSAKLTISSTSLKEQSAYVTQSGLPCGPDDETPCEIGGCVIPAMPSYSSLVDNPYLPDPFTFMNGTRMTTKEEWTCRRAEIEKQAMEYEFGYKPCTPYSATIGAFSSNVITVTVSQNNRTISFNCSITYPTTGTAPYPAIIAMAFSTLNNTEISKLGVAVINFPTDEIAEQQGSPSRGKGKFYDLFCKEQSAGALMAWSWGVSRLIDALEKTPEANIDPTRLGVTGCSRYGKGALCAGAFDERIVLTIPQESGSGGAANWRVSDYMGSSVQRLQQIVGENCWFRENFDQFSYTANKLPFDHHMIMALCAPRALLVIENTEMVWLGNLSTWVTGNAAHYVWEALGIPDNMGFSQNGHPDHCGLPDVQLPELRAYIQKFLFDNDTVNTTIMKTDGNLDFDTTQWLNWTIPNLQ